MDCKTYYKRQMKHFEDNKETIVSSYNDHQLKVQIELQRERIEKSLYCKVATPSKTKSFLSLLEKEAIKRGLLEARIKDLHENHKHSGKFAKVMNIKDNVYSLLFDDGLRYSLDKDRLILFS